jgi:tRNA G18 (ribose-2'-O)-methylase SpoU
LSRETEVSRADLAPRRRLEGLDSISEALDQHRPIALMLCLEGELSPSANEVVERARSLAIPILAESEREMRRMSETDPAAEVLALESAPLAETLDELMSVAGIVFVLVDLRYPANVGFILRAAEVAGSAGVVLANDWKGTELAEAVRVGMRADRFFPVLEGTANEAMASARRAGRRVVALETDGTISPWEVDLVTPTAVIVGSETTGLASSLLDQVDAVVRIPTVGFIPSYNVQAAVGMMLGEWLRQNPE